MVSTYFKRDTNPIQLFLFQLLSHHCRCFSSLSAAKRLVQFNSQITSHGKNGDLISARLVFDRMPSRDVVSWTALLTAYADNGDIVNARKVFDEMPYRNAASWNAMITGYAREGKLTEAFELFSSMPERNVVSYGTMIAGFAKNGLLHEAEAIYEETPRNWRDPVASNALMSGYLKFGELEKAVHVFQGTTEKDVFSWSSMVDGYCKAGRVSEARMVFDAMPERNVVSWTSMIRGYMKARLWSDGFLLFSEMRRGGVYFNSTTLSVVIDASAELGQIHQGMQIHELVLKAGFDSDVYICNSTIAMYARCGCMDAAQRSFDSMSKKNLVSWNSLISGYVQHDFVEEANKLFQIMPEKDAISWTAMLVGFSNRGLIKESVELFEEMPERDDIAWTAVISGFTNNMEYEKAFEWFGKMMREGVKPNPLVLSSVLSALAGSTILSQGRRVHGFVVKMDLEFDELIQTSLLSMYAKCGNLADAYQIFSRIDLPNLVCINAMLTAFAQHGFAHEALELFGTMEAKGIIPNEVSFLAILSACAHAGLVQEGYAYFKSMGPYYGIEPNADHYTCMVDLLGRAGLLRESLDLIKSMPSDNNPSTWGALLNASKMHFDLEITKVAAERLTELEPGNAAAYAVLSEMYSVSGSKKDAEDVRMAKQLHGIKKESRMQLGCARKQL